ncbi:hypothetical protein CJ030_MR7G015228 [Morella rubra]|uniref:ARMC9 CTLH-like domain-containing protein n=1 Tax=Morella rubra TaxID=262757 RepID=A0A6A1UYP5_9ROSI|nr:hypothetical protein CJ030_MR7G015228 [Morella rubra]
MENMQYAEELVREFLVFRGFTNTLQAFEVELRTDIGKGFQVDKILDLIFSVYVPKFQAEKLVALLSFFKKCLSSSSETVLITTLSKLEVSILRYYISHAIQSGRRDKVVELFEINGNEFLQRDEDWSAWFAVPYIKNPNLDPEFRIYFSKEWSRLPALLKISSEKNTANRLKKDIKQLNVKLSQLQALLEEKEAQLCRLRSNASAGLDGGIGQTKSSSSVVYAEDLLLSKDTQQACAPASPRLAGKPLDQDFVTGPSHIQSDLTMSNYFNGSIASSSLSVGDVEIENVREVYMDDEFPEVKVDFQETFLGHTSPISRCRFSASGNNIASASVDGTVRIWTYDSSTPASRNATIYCGAEIMSLDWECKSDRLLLIGTADGGIKAWNVDAKRVVCDLSTTEAFPSVLDLKCSPVEPIFVSAAASKGRGSSYVDNLGFASLTVWNMKMWKAMTVLPLGEEPPAITSLCFNHNGKILAASATDGMIHMFGILLTMLAFCDPESSKKCRHEMALDANGGRLLVTSGSVRAPIYQVRGQRNGLRTLPHTAAITTVDWHPTLPIFLTGSADNSVRVTSML